MSRADGFFYIPPEHKYIDVKSSQNINKWDSQHASQQQSHQPPSALQHLQVTDQVWVEVLAEWVWVHHMPVAP